VSFRPAPGLPEGLVLDGAFDAHGSALWAQGAIMPQSRGSMLVSRALGVESGDSVLDLCAAPGAKTTHLAALGAGRVVAVERNPGRASALRETCARMQAGAVEVLAADAASAGSPGAPGPIAAGTSFAAVLVDPPCSGLGTLQSRPDIRWRASEQQIAELSELQGAILAAAGRVVAPGGTLVYSVCTISAAEGVQVVDRFLSDRPDFRAEPLAERHPSYAAAAVGPYLQLLPDREGTDGFFIARLRRARPA
jgi:16S rRNA (cytosine967-C5)-methyltransferase